MKIPVVIDCDPGVDDALAILLAFSSDKLDIKAITTVAGNQTVEITTDNALKIVGFIGADIKIAKGASKPIMKKLKVADEVHGSTGLGNAVLPSVNNKAYFKNAVETIYEIAADCDGKLHIIALGPLTNIALLLTYHPDVCKNIEHITLMGGACYGGNVTPAAEFNIYTDPDAAEIVFKSGIPITMVGLDATHRSILCENEIRDIISEKSRVSEFIGQLMYSMLDFYRSIGISGAVMHDALTVASIIEPDIIKTGKHHVDIETKGEFTTGKTVVDICNVKKMTANAEIGLDADKEKFLTMLKEMNKSYAI